MSAAAIKDRLAQLTDTLGAAAREGLRNTMSGEDVGPPRVALQLDGVKVHGAHFTPTAIRYPIGPRPGDDVELVATCTLPDCAALSVRGSALEVVSGRAIRFGDLCVAGDAESFDLDTLDAGGNVIHTCHILFTAKL